MAGPIALREQTAGRLLRRLGEVPGGAGVRGAGAGGSPRVLVRCTDATAAGGSGIEAECYPGVVVQYQAGLALADQDADAGEVWLTVLSGEAAAEPAEGGLYWCILAGSVEAGGETRPRAFGVGAETLTYAADATGSVALPGAGTYLVWAVVNWATYVPDTAALDGANVTVWLRNMTAGADVANTVVSSTGISELVLTGGGGIRMVGNVTTIGVVEVTAADTIAVQSQANELGGGDVTTRSAVVIWYLRLAGASPAAGGGFTGSVP